MSRRQALLNDADGPSDDYIAYSQGTEERSQTTFSRKKKIVTGVVFLIALIAIGVSVGWYIWYRESDHHDPPSDVPAVALSYFLVQNVRPINYTLAFTADPDTGAFDGSMLIDAQITDEPVSAFYLHSLYLNIQSVDLTFDQVPLNHTQFQWGLNGQIESTASSANAQQNLWIKTLNQSFPVTDNLQISIVYNGTMPSTSSSGFYRTSYQTADGTINWIGSTQFEPTHARRAFPCFDEPAMKATWAIKITVPTKFKTVLSNAAIDTQVTNPATVVTTFYPTPKQSSYLVAFVISNFKSVTSQVEPGAGGTTYPFRGWGRADNDKYLTLQFMTDQAAQFQAEFHGLMGVQYPFPKLDQVAIPNKGGAMENYGLVLYSEPRLYVDNDTTSIVLEQAYNTNSHELAHFLFGDYMTPMWWSNNWLKEGSATFWSYVTIGAVMRKQGYGDWNTDALAVIGSQENALIADSDMNAPPLHDHRVETPYQIANHFGRITYDKGGSFLRMIRSVMGEAEFYTGCKAFLAKYAFSNAWGVDFFNVLNDNNPVHQNLNLTAFLLPWAEQAGFPLINVSVVPSSISGSNNWIITQQRYNAPDSDNTQWPIFLQYTVIDNMGGVTSDSDFMEATDASRVISVPATSIVKLNTDRAGFYRVRYDGATFDAIASLVEANSSVLHTNDRISLIHDVWQMQHDGLINDWNVVMNVTGKILSSEQEYAPMAAGLQRITDVWMRIRHAASVDDYETWMGWMKRLTGPWAHSLYWGPPAAGEHILGLAQSRLGPVACKWMDVACLEMADDAIFAWTFNNTIPHSNIRQTAFEFSQLETDDAFITCYRNEASTVIASFCLNGLLAHARTESIIEFYMTSFLNGHIPLRQEDSLAGVLERFIIKNDIARNVLVQYFKNNPAQWNLVRETVGDADSNLSMIIFTLVASAQTPDQLSDVTNWISPNVPSTNRVQRALADAQTTAEHNIDWVATNWPSIKNWITQALTPIVPPVNATQTVY